MFNCPLSETNVLSRPVDKKTISKHLKASSLAFSGMKRLHQLGLHVQSLCHRQTQMDLRKAMIVLVRASAIDAAMAGCSWCKGMEESTHCLSLCSLGRPHLLLLILLLLHQVLPYSKTRGPLFGATHSNKPPPALRTSSLTFNQGRR